MINLMHGDCLELMKDIPDGSVDMILCDLPYGTTQNPWDSVIPFEALWQHYLRIGKLNCAYVLTAQPPFDKLLGASNIKILKYEWIWIKPSATGFLNAKKAPLKNAENILVFYRRPPTYNPQMREGFKPYKSRQGIRSKNYGAMNENNISESDGDRYPVTTLQFNNERGLHPTQKPIALMEYLIRTYTNEGETVLDNCMGSGTCGVASLNTNRRFIGIERELKYFDIARQRIEAAQQTPAQAGFSTGKETVAA